MGDGGKKDWLPRSQGKSRARASQGPQQARRAARGLAGRRRGGLWERERKERQRETAEGVPAARDERVAL